MVLFINACVRSESRTKHLAEHLLSALEDSVNEVCLETVAFPDVNESFLKERDSRISTRQYDHPMFVFARDFAEADTIVVAAPYWDLSFPSSLKQYFEQICVTGITFEYTEDGTPHGLCRAKKIYYITTSGGPMFQTVYGYGYVKALAEVFFGIQEIHLISAEGLDLPDADIEGILQQSIDEIDTILNKNGEIPV